MRSGRVPSGEAEIFQCTQGKARLFQTVSGLLLARHAHPQMVEYLNHAIADFQGCDMTAEGSAETLLHMQVLLADALIQTQELAAAAAQLDRAKHALDAYEGENREAYRFRYVIARSSVLKYGGDSQSAAKILTQALSGENLEQSPQQQIALLRTLSDQYFNLCNFAEVAKTLEVIKDLPAFEEIQENQRLQLEVFELVNLLEAGEPAQVEGRIKPIKKQYRQLLKQEGFMRTRKFIELLHRISSAAMDGKSIAIRAAYQGFQELHPESDSDSEAMVAYDLYLQSRLENRSYYELFLEKVRSAAG